MEGLRHLNLKRTGETEIPKGLEEWLSMKIDQWAAEEENTQFRPTCSPRQPRSRASRFSLARIISAAACITLMAGLITLWPKHRTNKAQQDTFDDPELARKEVIKAFQLMEYSLNIGREHLELAEDITNESMNTLDNALETLKTLE